MNQEIIKTLNKIGVQPDSITLAEVRLALGDTLVGQQSLPHAMRIYQSLRNDLAGSPQVLLRVFSESLNWAIPMLSLSRVEKYPELLSQVLDARREQLGDKHYLTAEALGFMACLWAQQGNPDKALQGFAQAVPRLIEQSRLNLGQKEAWPGKLLRRRFILESYLELLSGLAAGEKLASGRSREDEAFFVAEAARGGMVNRAMAMAASRSDIKDPALAALARQEQDTRLRLATLNGNLTRLGRDVQKKAVLKRQIKALQTSHARIYKEIIDSFPAYADLISPKPGERAEVQRVLRPHEVLIITYVLPRRTLVWTLASKGEVRMVLAGWGKLGINRAVKQLRRALAPDAVTLNGIPDLNMGMAFALYRKLFAPTSDIWQPARHLIYVPHGSLATVPLHLLPFTRSSLEQDRDLLFDKYRKVDWMARKWAISQIPNANSLVLLRSGRAAPKAQNPFLGICDPAFDPQEASQSLAANASQDKAKTRSGNAQSSLPILLRSVYNAGEVKQADVSSLPRLPETYEEVQAIANILNASTTLDIKARVQASEKTVFSLNAQKKLASYRVVSFATHGLMAGDLDGLNQPALALSHPRLTGQTGDGLLTMQEILGLDLNADWVILSACNTAASDGAGSEAISGLGRSFFYAGARSLLVSSWPVHSQATKELMVKIFQRDRKPINYSRSEQVRRAMISLIEDGEYRRSDGRAVFSYAHPLFWAPFFVAGEGN